MGCSQPLHNWRYKCSHTSHFADFEQAEDEGRFAVFGQIKEDCCFDDFELVKHDVYFLMFMQVEIIYDIIYA